MNPVAKCCMLLGMAALASGSQGDRSWIFQKCVRNCNEINCTRISEEDYAGLQPFYERWTGWTCIDNCKYDCMWKAVDAFQKDQNPFVPQFYGKWPFLRWLGMQEPASVIFSILNGLAHVVMVVYYHFKVPSSAPMYYLWHVYAVVAVNAWLWSIIFHTRDLPLTEKMDYFCAFSYVLCSLFILCARLIGTQRWLIMSVVSVAIVVFFTSHVHYLAFVKFDYGYNMTANVTVGLINTAGWIFWCYHVRHQQPYVWKAVVTLLALNLLITLELGDFAPLWWTFDAHSLWHAGTAPLALLWYSFAIDDSLYLDRQQHIEVKTDAEKKIS